MTASSAERGMGTLLYDVSFNVAFAEIDQIGEFGISRPDIDVTTHDSSDNAMYYIAGVLDGGTLQIQGNLKSGDTSGQMQAITDCIAGTHKSYKIVLPNTAASEFAFWGHCSQFRINPQLKGALRFSAAFRISGKPTWTV